MASGTGIVSKPSPYSVPETLNRLEKVLESKHIAVFARIDHSGEAAKVGLALRPTQVLIFGNPRAGTPLMAAYPELALDLPLKALAWENSEGKVWLSHNTPEYLKDRFAISDDLLSNISGIGGLLDLALA